MNEARRRTPLLAFLALCLAFAGMLLLSGCDNNNDQLIRETLDENLNIQDEELETISDELNAEGVLSEYGVELGDYEGTLLQGYSYNIDSIEINGSSATATITITFRDFTACIQTFQQSLEDDRDNLEALKETANTKSGKKKKVAEAEAAQVELKETVDGYLTEALEEAGSSSNSTSFTIGLSEEDGEWVIDDETTFAERWFDASFGETLKQLENAEIAAQAEPEEENDDSDDAEDSEDE